MPNIYLQCKHILHEDCLMHVLDQKWTGPRINFAFTECPLCKREMETEHFDGARALKDARSLRKKLEKMAVERAKHEGIHKDERMK